jgi:hypothetical protein
MNNIELHIFENHHNYDLMLPRPAHKNLTIVKPKSKFFAEKDFQEYVKVGMIRYIGPYKKEEVLVESKLILDQPNIVTTEGTVEHVATGQTCKKKVLKEGEGEKLDEVLLVESPSAGIKIITD